MKSRMIPATLAALALIFAGYGVDEARAGVITANDGVNDWMLIDGEGSFDDAFGAFAKVGFANRANEHDCWSDNAYHPNTPFDGLETATWTFKGLTNGTYAVAVSWSAGGNRASNAPYSIDGGAPILVNQKVLATDLTLTGGGGPDVFDYLSQTVVVSDGDLSVFLSDNFDGYGMVDAVAIRLIPEPATMALLGLGGLGVLLSRKRR